MMLYNSITYTKDLEEQYKRIDFTNLKNKKILITGACGLICSYLIDLLIYANEFYNQNIKIYALSRNEQKLKARFKNYSDKEYFIPIIKDVRNNLDIEEVDYIIHGASNATPRLYIEDPVGTMNSNYLGMLNILNLAKKNNSKVLFISSGDIYGKIADNITLCTESDYGYIDILDTRASYSMSKRATETLCISYKEQYNLNVGIVRPAHIYGPTFTNTDNRAVSDFLRNVTNNEDIIMKSNGSSVRSYCYVGDTVVGILKVLLSGENGKAYNISNENNIISIKELAEIIAKKAGKKLIIQLPKDEINKKIDNNVKIIKFSSDNLKKLGWECLNDIETGIEKSINIIQELK